MEGTVVKEIVRLKRSKMLCTKTMDTMPWEHFRKEFPFLHAFRDIYRSTPCGQSFRHTEAVIIVAQGRLATFWAGSRPWHHPCDASFVCKIWCRMQDVWHHRCFYLVFKAITKRESCGDEVKEVMTNPGSWRCQKCEMSAKESHSRWAEVAQGRSMWSVASKAFSRAVCSLGSSEHATICPGYQTWSNRVTGLIDCPAGSQFYWGPTSPIYVLVPPI